MGKSINLPDSSLIIPLCQCLDIEIQELLLGEYCEKKDLLNESNELIIDLMKDKITDQEAFMTYKFILVLCLVAIILFFVPMLDLFQWNFIFLCLFIALRQVKQLYIHKKRPSNGL